MYNFIGLECAGCGKSKKKLVLFSKKKLVKLYDNFFKNIISLKKFKKHHYYMVPETNFTMDGHRKIKNHPGNSQRK